MLSENALVNQALPIVRSCVLNKRSSKNYTSDLRFFEIARCGIACPKMLGRYFCPIGGLATLKNQTIRWKCPLEFSDDQDCRWDSLWNVHTPEFAAREREAKRQQLVGATDWSKYANRGWYTTVSRARMLLAEMKGEAKEKSLEEYLADRDLRRKKEEFEARHTDLKRRLRVLCLTEDLRSQRMWSEYAGNSCGVMLVFDIKCLMWFWKRPVERVQYLEQFPELVNADEWLDGLLYFRRPKAPKDLRLWSLVKRTTYSWEREWRFVSVLEAEPQNSYSEFPFLPRHIRGIVLGANADQATCKEIQELRDKLYKHAWIWKSDCRREMPRYTSVYR